MTDRELLELAAKAAGIPVRDLDSRYDCWEETPVLIHRAWNPLTDDGDAFRLAVNLRLEVDIGHDGIAVRTPQGHKILIHAAEQADPHIATRRAIVRAAAEMGEAM